MLRGLSLSLHCSWPYRIQLGSACSTVAAKLQPAELLANKLLPFWGSGVARRGLGTVGAVNQLSLNVNARFNAAGGLIGLWNRLQLDANHSELSLFGQCGCHTPCPTPPSPRNKCVNIVYAAAGALFFIVVLSCKSQTNCNRLSTIDNRKLEFKIEIYLGVEVVRGGWGECVYCRWHW